MSKKKNKGQKQKKVNNSINVNDNSWVWHLPPDPSFRPDMNFPEFQQQQSLKVPAVSKKNLQLALDFCCNQMCFINADFLDSFFQKYVDRLRARSYRIVFIGTSQGYRHSIAQAVSDFLMESNDRSLVREFLSGFSPQNFLTDAYKVCKGKTQSQIDWVIQQGISRAEKRQNGHIAMPFAFAFLYLWSQGIESYYIDKFFKENCLFTIQQDYSYAERIFHIKGDFFSADCIKSYTQRIRAKIAAFVGIEDSQWALEKRVLSGLNFGSPFEEELSEISGFDTRYIVKLLELNGIYAYSDQEDPEILQAGRDAINDTIASYLLTCYEEEYIERMRAMKQASSISGVLNNQKIPLKAFEESAIAKYVRQINPESLFLSCVWASAVYLCKDYVKTDMLGEAFFECRCRSLEKEISASNLEQMKEQIKTLAAENDSLMKKIKGASYQRFQSAELENEQLKHEHQELKAQLADLQENMSAEIAGIQEQAATSENFVRQQRKKIEELEGDLSDANAEMDALREKISLLEELRKGVIEQEDRCLDIDTEKKYLFIINDEKMRYKIRAWFPNSVISENLDINPKNGGSYYMAIFVTKSIGHDEYFRVKQRCTIYGIPICYCNQINYRLVCQAIAKCARDYNLA